MQRPATLTLLAIAAVTTAGLQAQRPAHMRFQGMDRNGDGIIQRDEWQGTARAFANQDWNGDGVLSGPEVRVGAQRDTNWETADHVPNRAERNLSWTASAFTNLDHNRDGRLTPSEWHYDTETFRRIDGNRNNAVSRAEFLGANADDGRDISFDDLDVNNNGRVERSEWYFAGTTFTSLDRNRDGTLSRFEVVGTQDTTGDTYNEFATTATARSLAMNGIGRRPASLSATSTEMACYRSANSTPWAARQGRPRRRPSRCA